MRTFSFRGAYRIRWQVFARDNFTCQYCGRKAPNVTLEIDHKNPVSNGGSWELDNLVTACAACNRGKGALTQFLVLDKCRQMRKEAKIRVPTVADRIAKELTAGDKRVRELTGYVGNSKGTVSRTLRRMAEKGDVVRIDNRTWRLVRK